MAKKYQCIAVLTGEVDYISDGVRLYTLHNGTPLLPKVTASGCLLSAIVGAFLAVAERPQYLQACVEACATFAIAGELASDGLTSQSGTFMIRLLDRLGDVTPEQIAQKAVLTER